jgi:hypothetical protein
MKEVIIKILLLSTLLSYLVKYGGRYLPIESSNINAIIAIITPTLVMAILLFLRANKQPSNN